jgi:hypothetical protein
MKWFNAIRWLLEIYLLVILMTILVNSYSGLYSNIQYDFSVEVRLIINILFALFILLRIFILGGKSVLNWNYKYSLVDFEKKSKVWSLIAVIGYMICLVPDYFLSFQWYSYTNLYLGRLLILPLPIILGFVDIYLFKPSKNLKH